MTPTRLLLVRHGETDWARDWRHTGRTDVPLNAHGVQQARRLQNILPRDGVVAVWSSPLSRAADTAALAGLHVDRFDDDLMEWDYGPAEGRTTEEIRLDHPGWEIWHDGVHVLAPADGTIHQPGHDNPPASVGETVDQVGERVDRVIARARTVEGMVVVVAHAHLCRILAARWVGLPASGGRHFALDPAGWALLAWTRDEPVVERWNPPPP